MKNIQIDKTKLSKAELLYLEEYERVIKEHEADIAKHQVGATEIKTNPPQYYWKIAKKYIIEQSKYLEENEPLYYLDKQFALNCVKLASLFKHTSGTLENKNFQFNFWQIKAIVDIFGTKYTIGAYEGLRRYQRALFHMPKKNGKTETGALFHIIVLYLDEALSKEQYCIASDKEQALILHEAIETMFKSNDYGAIEEIDKITIQPPRITKTDSSGIYKQTITSLAKPLGDSKDGKKVTFFTSDEGHAQESKNLYQLVKNGMALVKEPLEINLSTSGYNMQGYYYKDIYQYACKVRDGIIEDKRFYPVIFELDESDYLDKNGKEIEDFWKDKKLWKKVNPNLGISPTYSFMEGLVSEAEHSEESRVTFLTKHLNMWMDKAETWIKHSIWTANQTKIGFTKLKELRNKKCYGGLDLSTNIDITSLVLVFYDESGSYDVIPYFWIPKDNMRERARIDKVSYLDWHKDGLIKSTEGNIIDYDFLEKDIKRVCEFFNVQMIGYDRWNSSDLVRRLTDQDVVELIKIGQGISLTASNKQIETLSRQGKLNHGDNPILNWMCSNVVINKDSNDNYKIDKDKSIEKVDGMVALSMALSMAIADTKTEESNVYERRGMLIL